MKKFTAFDSHLVTVDVLVKKNEIDLEISGVLSPFLGNVKKRLKKYIQDGNYKIKNNKLYLTSAFPPIPSEAFDRLVRNELKRLIGINYPTNLTIMVTGECGCNCKHCLAKELMGQEKLSSEEIKDLINQALNIGVSQVVFEGGEPTLRKDLPELIGYVDDRATTMVVTNGGNIDKNKIKEFESSGLDFLNFSLDSPRPKKHNEFRKKENLFKQLIKGINESVKSNILTGILYIANPKNIGFDELNELIELARSHDVFEVMIDEVVDSGNWRNQEVLGEKEIDKLKEFNKKLINEDETNLLNLFFTLREAQNFGCFAGRRWLYSSPRGEIMPCMHTPISFGNIKEKSLKNIWKKIRANKLFNNPNKCVYEKEYYKKEYLEDMNEKGKFPYKIGEK